MPQISIVFGDIYSDDVESYIRQRVSLLHHASSSQVDGQRSMLREETLSKYVEELTASLGKASKPPIAVPVDLSSLPKRNAEIQHFG